MNSEDGQVYSVCILQFSCFTEYNRLQSKHKQTNCKHSRRITAFSVGITILNQKIIYIDDINLSLNSHVYWETLYIIQY